jgi:hypothetical protein
MKRDCAERAEALAMRIAPMVDKADLCPFHSLALVASVMARTLHYALPDELVCDGIDRAATMAKELVLKNMKNAPPSDHPPIDVVDLKELVEMLMSGFATKH